MANLTGMLISSLNLESSGWLSDAGVAHLSGLPLTQLNVTECPGLSVECQEGLAVLQTTWEVNMLGVVGG